MEPSLQSNYLRSIELINIAKKSIAGGADSTMRVLPYHLPTVIVKAEGPYVWDADGHRLIDMNMAYGPLLFGHKHPLVKQAILDEFDVRGSIVGFPHTLSHQAAEYVKRSFPSIQKMRFASTGSEVIQTAVRLAREFTHRPTIVLFEGNYHGSTDSVFYEYHAPLEKLVVQGYRSPLPGTGGMLGCPHDIIVIPWNDFETIRDIFNASGEEIAAVILAPVMGNSGVIPPKQQFLQEVRSLTYEFGSLLIFDEIITGYRIARGGGQERYGVSSDLTALSKGMSGGVPTSAIGGREDIMQLIEDYRVFHGGVYSGNSLSMAVTLAIQREIDRNHVAIYNRLEHISNRLASGLRTVFDRHNINVVVQNAGAMLSLWFVRGEKSAAFHNYRDVSLQSDRELYIAFQHLLQEKGVYIHPNHYEPWFPSLAHSDNVIDDVLDTVDSVADKIVAVKQAS